MIFGDPAVFAIEYELQNALASRSLSGTGLFIVHVSGRGYGIRETHAATFGSSLQTVSAVLENRGKHSAFFCDEPDGAGIALTLFAFEQEYPWSGSIFGMDYDAFIEWSRQSTIGWRTRGLEEFDDSTRIVQFDKDDMSRIIAYRGDDSPYAIMASTSDVWLKSDDLYAVLENFITAFHEEWRRRTRNGTIDDIVIPYRSQR